MKAVTCHHALILAAALATAALAGCADVHQNPATNTVNGQSDAAASQAANVQSPSPASVPF
ncbi:hypothetical protein [Cognatiluteimonas profundi]|uniref:hypothetical protein n=1 Tax=Cognatiluteimonas profundi TaxID=2594501 RepID=UPI00131CB69F|nr:hypothetical protein [Lysobacter profundi]